MDKNIEIRTNKHEVAFNLIGHNSKFYEILKNPILMEKILFHNLYWEKKIKKNPDNKLTASKSNNDDVKKGKNLKIELEDVKKSKSNNTEENQQKFSPSKSFNESIQDTSIAIPDGSLLFESLNSNNCFLVIDKEYQNKEEISDGCKMEINYHYNPEISIKDSKNKETNDNKEKDKNQFSKNNPKIMKKTYKLISKKENSSHKTIEYFVSESRLNPLYYNLFNPELKLKEKFNPQIKNTKKLIQYDLVYKVFTISSYSILIKVEIKLHSNEQWTPLFNDKISKVIEKQFLKEVSKPIYYVKKNEETIMIKASRNIIMETFTDFANLEGCEVILNRLCKNSEGLDSVGDKWSVFYQQWNALLEFEVTEYVSGEDLDIVWNRKSYLYNSVPDTNKFSCETKMKAIDESLSILDFNHYFDEPISFEAKKYFSKDQKELLLVIKDLSEKKQKIFNDQKGK